jgi:transposase
MMMGIKNSSGKLLYRFSLEDRVPDKHLLRSIREAVGFSFIRRIAEPFYSYIGAPSAEHIVALKMALLGYLYGIARQPKLAEECRLNMAFVLVPRP